MQKSLKGVQAVKGMSTEAGTRAQLLFETAYVQHY